MNSVGIDLHRKRSQVAVIDDEGTETVSRRIVNDPATFLELLAALDGGCRIALEATYGWEWLADLLRDAGRGHGSRSQLKGRAGEVLVAAVTVLQSGEKAAEEYAGARPRDAEPACSEAV